MQHPRSVRHLAADSEQVINDSGIFTRLEEISNMPGGVAVKVRTRPCLKSERTQHGLPVSRSRRL